MSGREERASRAPRQLIVGPREHGVVSYARSLAIAVAQASGRASAIEEDSAEVVQDERVHLQFTDRIFGSDPGSAAARVAEIAQTARISVTLHDIPQPSDGDASMARRAEAYRSVLRSARGAVCNSLHEAELIRLHVDPDARSHVIPLPVEAPMELGALDEPSGTSAPTVGIVGFVYPGKGHREAIDAVADAHAAHPSALLPRSVTAFGRASAGHDRDVEALRAHADRRGVAFEVTGYLSDEELLRRCATATVPLSAHQHISASGSINTWLRAGRRPLVLDGRYAREMARLRPDTLSLVPPGDLAAAIAAAAAHPESTRLSATTSLRPLLDDTARAYLAWWQEVAW